MKIYITLLIGLFLSLPSMSQSSLKNADKLFKTQAYTKAAKAYKEFLAEYEGEVEIQTLLNAGDANYFIYNTSKAKQYYQRAFNRKPNIKEPYISRYVRTLRSEEDYEFAHKVALKALKESNDDEALNTYKKQYDAFLELLNSEEDSEYRLMNISANSKYSDFAPVIFGDSIVFSSSRTGNSKELYSWNEQPYLSLYIASKGEDGDLIDAKPFSKSSKSDYHDATLAIMPDTNIVFFASSNINKNKLVLDSERENNFKLYSGELKNGVIKNREELNFNSDSYSVGHPSISDDGKYFFFASDMEQGYGGSDIYYCKITPSGKLTTPKNAGPEINTSGNDFFPHMKDGVLYFASNGHVGFGGLDVFQIEFNRDTEDFTNLQNLGKTVNTSYDDFSMVFNSDGMTGYLASNRTQGVGDDDIYYFTKEPIPCDQILFGNIKDLRTKENLAEVTVTIKDSLNETISILKTDADGNYEIKLPCLTKVTILAEKEDYFEQEKIGETGDVDGEENESIDFELERAKDMIVVDETTKQEKIDLETIYFDFDKADITPQAAAVLDKAVKLMNFYPDMVINIESHTDSRGSKKYNYSLSDRRAKATQQYIYSQGIAEERIVSAQGYGEQRLLNECKDGVKCSDEEHDVNRRSDFIILKR